jgi:hypothetical protein
MVVSDLLFQLVLKVFSHVCLGLNQRLFMLHLSVIPLFKLLSLSSFLIFVKALQDVDNIVDVFSLILTRGKHIVLEDGWLFLIADVYLESPSSLVSGRHEISQVGSSDHWGCGLLYCCQRCRELLGLSSQ